MSGRNSQVSRIYQVLTLLETSHYGLTMNDLREKVREAGYEVSVRSLYRDLEALQSFGLPLTETANTTSQGTRWKLDHHTKIGQYLALSGRELMALYLAKHLLAPLKDTPFYQDLAVVFGRIEAHLGEKGREMWGELEGELKVEPGPRWGLGLNPEIIDTVRAACAERHILEVTYASATSGTERQRRLGPHILYFAKGSLYLLAEDLEEAKVKVFALPRMKAATMLDDGYNAEAVDPDSYFAGSFGIFHGHTTVPVSIEFKPPVSMFVQERQWHRSQRVVNRTNNRIELNLEVALTPELVQWVLGFGAFARVIGPPELIEQVQQQAREVLDSYKKPAA